MEFSTLYIEVTIYGGCQIKNALTEMVAMARHLRCGVWADVNNIRTLARPNDDPADLIEAYDRALENHHSHAATGIPPLAAGQEQGAKHGTMGNS